MSTRRRISFAVFFLIALSVCGPARADGFFETELGGAVTNCLIRLLPGPLRTTALCTQFASKPTVKRFMGCARNAAKVLGVVAIPAWSAYAKVINCGVILPATAMKAYVELITDLDNPSVRETPPECVQKHTASYVIQELTTNKRSDCDVICRQAYDEGPFPRNHHVCYGDCARFCSSILKGLGRSPAAPPPLPAHAFPGTSGLCAEDDSGLCRNSGGACTGGTCQNTGHGCRCQ